MSANSVTKYTLYKIEDVATRKGYIGYTSMPVHRRWAGHMASAAHDPRHAMAKALATHKDSFLFTVLAVFDDVETAKNAEKLAIRIHNTVSPHGYNLTAGGDGANEASAETREKMRAAATGRKQSAETTEKRRLAMLGKPQSAEKSARIKAATTGKKRSAEFKALMSVKTKAHFVNNPHERERVSQFMTDQWARGAYANRGSGS